MGTVWVAHDQQLHRRVAIKLMQPELLLSSALRSQFAHEARAVAQLQHSHVVHIYDYGIDQDEAENSVPFLVMELLTGENLASRITRQRRVLLADAITMITQVAKALSAAHGVGLVHRDIKPDNIFLARSEGGEIAKLLDFGVAAMKLQRSDASELLNGGTPHYMSPEQIKTPEAVDHRSELFSLGIVAYEALTGIRPFDGSTTPELLASIASGADFVPPSRLHPDLGEHVDRFFDKAMARDPAQRFASAREMGLAFSSLLDQPGARRRIRVLVVDDESDVHVLIRHRFRQQIRHYEFLFASDGVEALDRLAQERNVDVILSDINMPNMDGISLLQRAAEIDPLLKVVIVSAYGDMRNIRAAMNRGAFDFLTKPIDFRDLSVTIDKTAQHVQATRMAAHWAEENARLRHLVKGDALGAYGRDTLDDFPVSERCEIAVAVVRVTGWDASDAPGDVVSPDLAMSRLNTLLDLIFTEITAHDGAVDSLIGSAVVAVFRGENRVLRSLAACLAIRARWPDALRGEHGVAIGVGSGQAFTGGVVARPARRTSGAAVGGAVGKAVALGFAAERGQILVRESVRAQASEVFAYEKITRLPALSEIDEVALYNLLNETPGPLFAQSPRGSRDEIAMAATLAQESGESTGDFRETK
jgi:eukaryotic-like serine/threonine-protein kinase